MPPGLYWIGGVLQGVSTTQPTFRTGFYFYPSLAMSSTIPNAGTTVVGYEATGVTGALPATFPAFASAAVAGTIPRVGFRVT
jgi:hypothetical protein